MMKEAKTQRTAQHPNTRLKVLSSAKESFVSESSRWRVKLSTGDMKDLKAENLRVLDLKESQASSFAGFLSHGI